MPVKILSNSDLTSNSKYKFPMVFTFVLFFLFINSVVLNALLRAVQVDTEESHLMTLDRCIACKNQLKTPVVAAQAGSPLPISLDQLWEFRERRGGQGVTQLTFSQPQLR
ncbi:unnamed protein product [Pipistrellus nathusii]|uniref:Uncharacterized protein n=1 Tax=Pipistrellus nathusii TaxID=59473 RepID=A0ABP0A0Z1_PIPNA